MRCSVRFSTNEQVQSMRFTQSINLSELIKDALDTELYTSKPPRDLHVQSGNNLRKTSKQHAPLEVPANNMHKLI